MTLRKGNIRVRDHVLKATRLKNSSIRRGGKGGGGRERLSENAAITNASVTVGGGGDGDA
jgi:hypothetical protein